MNQSLAAYVYNSRRHKRRELLRISAPDTIPVAETGTPYELQVAFTGGARPLTFAVVGAPPGIAIDGATGELSGTPTDAGAYTVIVTGKDAVLVNAQSVAFNITVE